MAIRAEPVHGFASTLEFLSCERPRFWRMLDEEQIAPCLIPDDPVQIRLTEFPHGGRVSTVFLGIDLDWRPDADPNLAPLLWETMAFDIAGHALRQDRHRSREAALACHELTVAALGGGF